MPATTNHILRENTPHRRETAPVISGKPKLLDQFREALRSRHYSRRTEQTYAQWVGACANANGAQPEVSKCPEGLALAVGFSAGKPLDKFKDKGARPPSH